MRPDGAAGRVFGRLMEALNAPAYAFALRLLRLQSDCDVLEIGFGTGRMIELILQNSHGRVFGVDPSAAMVDVACRRRRVRQAGDRIDLRLGDDTLLDFPARSLDRIVAIHSFQFWTDPAATTARLVALLRPGGRLVLVLRDHSRRAPKWLPNPLSRQPDEPAAVERLLGAFGFSPRQFHQGGLVAVVGDLPN